MLRSLIPPKRTTAAAILTRLAPTVNEIVSHGHAPHPPRLFSEEESLPKVAGISHLLPTLEKISMINRSLLIDRVFRQENMWYQFSTFYLNDPNLIFRIFKVFPKSMHNDLLKNMDPMALYLFVYGDKSQEKNPGNVLKELREIISSNNHYLLDQVLANGAKLYDGHAKSSENRSGFSPRCP